MDTARQSSVETADALTKGMAVLVPVNGIGTRFMPVDLSASHEKPLYDIVTEGERAFIRQWVDDNPDPRRDHRAVMVRKAKTYATALSVATFGNVWVEPVILNDRSDLIWSEPADPGL